jgi:hypothetical protein
VFVYSPFLILTLLGSIYFLPRLKRKPLFWLIVVWTLLHLLLVARTTRWWGGLSFGPRILTELLPGLVLLTAIVAQVYSERVTHRGLRIAAVGLFGGLAVWAIFLNSYQALFNHYTAWWHNVLAPNVEHELDYLWSWEYPPFLADNEMLCRRDRNYIDEVIADPKFAQHIYPYWPGRPLDTLTNKPFIIYEFLEQEEETAEPPIIQRTFEPVSPGSFLPALFFDGENKLDVILSGWAIPQLGYRWSMCEVTSISFKLDNRVDLNDSYELAILGGSYGEQRVEISLNGVELGQLLFNNRPNMPVSHSISIPEEVLEPGAVNRVRLNLPDSVIPETDESRRLGLALYSLTVEPAP